MTCLGTFKRYLRIILQGNVSEEDRIHKLSNHLIKRFDELVTLFCKYLLYIQMNSTAKYNHQRSWDAEKQLIFGHFICIQVCIQVLPEDEYNNFLYFFVAMRLLLSRPPKKRQIVFAI